MKIASLIFWLATSAVTALSSPAGAAVAARGLDCRACTRSYDFCIKNGLTEGQTGCMQTCREHVCFQNAVCKGCGKPFDQCPQLPRYDIKE